MTARRALLLSIAAVTMAFTIGPRTATSQPALLNLRIATVPNDVGAEVYYAEALGLFKKAGFDVTISSIDNGAAIAAAVAGGAADIGEANVVSIVTGYQKKLPFVVIAPAGAYDSAAPTTMLVTLANTPMKTAKDCNGKTFGTNGLLNIAQIGGEAWLDKNGANYHTVRWLEIPSSATAAALTSHRVDAALMSEPSLSSAMATGNFRAFAAPYDAIGKHWQLGAWFSTKDWVAAHPDDARRFASVMLQAARWANGHHDESLKLLGDVAKTVYPKQMRRAMYTERLDPQLFQPVIESAVKYGVIPASFPATDLFVQRAAQPR